MASKRTEAGLLVAHAWSVGYTSAMCVCVMRIQEVVRKAARLLMEAVCRNLQEQAQMKPTSRNL